MTRISTPYSSPRTQRTIAENNGARPREAPTTRPKYYIGDSPGILLSMMR
jgi:hypothetical protein